MMSEEQKRTEEGVDELIEEFFGETRDEDGDGDEQDEKKEDKDLDELEEEDEDEDKDEKDEKSEHEDEDKGEDEESEDKGEEGKDKKEEIGEKKEDEDSGGNKEEDEEDEEEPSLKTQNELLMKRIEELSSLQPPPPSAPAQASEEKGETKAPSILEFLKEDEDLDDVVSTPKMFNDVLSRVYAKASEDVEKRILGSISPIVVNQIMRQAKLKDAIDEFFDDNEDLKVVRKTVGLMTREVMAEDPKASLETVFEKAAEKTRTMFGLRKPAKTKAKNGKRRPALRKKTRSSKNRPVGDKRTSQQKEIDDLIS